MARKIAVVAVLLLVFFGALRIFGPDEGHDLPSTTLPPRSESTTTVAGETTVPVTDPETGEPVPTDPADTTAPAPAPGDSPTVTDPAAPATTTPIPPLTTDVAASRSADGLVLHTDDSAACRNVQLLWPVLSARDFFLPDTAVFTFGEKEQGGIVLYQMDVKTGKVTKSIYGSAGLIESAETPLPTGQGEPRTLQIAGENVNCVP